MGNYVMFGRFENPRRGIQARNLTTTVAKILDLKSSSEQIFSKNCPWVPLIPVLVYWIYCLCTEASLLRMFYTWGLYLVVFLIPLLSTLLLASNFLPKKSSGHYSVCWSTVLLIHKCEDQNSLD